MSQNPDHATTEPRQRRRVSAWQVLKSTLAAAIGVQSNKNRQQDFEQGSFFVYLFAGLAFSAAFILVLVLVVRAVLANT